MPRVNRCQERIDAKRIIVKTTDDRSTNQSTANTPPSFGRNSAFGVRPKGKREIEPRPQRMLCLKATTHV